MLVIATIAIFFLGVGVFLGKVNWGLATTVVIGVILMVISPDIVRVFMSGDVAHCIRKEFDGARRGIYHPPVGYQWTCGQQ